MLHMCHRLHLQSHSWSLRSHHKGKSPEKNTGTRRQCACIKAFGNVTMIYRNEAVMGIYGCDGHLCAAGCVPPCSLILLGVLQLCTRDVFPSRCQVNPIQIQFYTHCFPSACISVAMLHVAVLVLDGAQAVPKLSTW